MEPTEQASKFFKDYQKEEVIFEESSRGYEMYIVHSGKVKLTTSAPGRTVELGIVEKGGFFGEMALVDPGPRTATAVAAEDGTRLIVLDQEKFLYLVLQQPAFVMTLMRALCMRVRDRWTLYSDVLKNGQPAT
jgi:CRP/FNR family transcriptional regulator, cyclic AMP receptor protein